MCKLSSATLTANLERFQHKPSEDVVMIRQADLENHNKDGGMWVVIHGKVYDVHDFKSQAQCGTETLAQYAGMANPLYFSTSSSGAALQISRPGVFRDIQLTCFSASSLRVAVQITCRYPNLTGFSKRCTAKTWVTACML